MPYDPWEMSSGFGGPLGTFNPQDDEYGNYRWWLDPNYIAMIGANYGSVFGGNRGSSAPPGATPTPQRNLPGGYDSQSGLPHDLTQQIWGLDVPEGFDTSGFNADSFVQRGLPVWASQRFQELSDQLGGWDNLGRWLEDATNWSTVLGIMRNPWGQSAYDQYPQGTSDQQPQPQQPNEGQTVETPEGTPPSGGTSGVPNYPTDVYGSSGLPDWIPPAIGAGLGAGLGLGSIFGGAGSEQPGLAPTGPDGNPVFTATGTTTPIPVGSENVPFTGSLGPLGGEQPTIGPNGQPTWSVTGTATSPGLSPTPSPIGNLDPAQYPGIFAPTIPSPIGGLEPGQTPPASQTPQTPSVPSVPGAAAGGGGIGALPASFPTLPAHAPISPLFQMPPMQGMVPGLNQILRGLL